MFNKDIKTLVILSPEVVGYPFMKHVKNKNKTNKPSGYLYNLFTIIKNKLNHKYNFKIEYSNINENNYDNFVNKVYNNEYDLVVGSFYINEKREKLINYTHPLYYNSNAILHIKKSDNFKILLKSVYHIFKPILILIILGIIIGLILYIFEPNRSSYLKHVRDDTDYGKFKRTLLTSIAGFLGEMGFLSEQSSLKTHSIIFIIFIIITIFLITMIIQSRLNAVYASFENEINTLDIKNINKYSLLGFKGNAESQKIEKLGANVHYVENLTEDDIINKYLNNTDKYNGVIIPYIVATIYIDDILGITYKGLGIEAISFIVNKNNNELLNDFNYNILKLRENKVSYSLCKEYLSFKQGCIE